MIWEEFQVSSSNSGLIAVWISEDSYKDHVGKDY